MTAGARVNRWTYGQYRGECWGQGYQWTYRRHSENGGARVQTQERPHLLQGRPTQKTSGRPTQAPAGTNPRNGPFDRYPLLLLLFNLAGALMCFFLWAFMRWEVAVRTWAAAGVSYCVSEIVDHFGWSVPRVFPGSVVSPVWHTVPTLAASAFSVCHWALSCLFLSHTAGWGCAGPMFRCESCGRPLVFP